MVSLEEHEAFIEQCKDRSKRRRLDLGLPAPGEKQKVVLKQEAERTDAGSSSSEKQRKKMAYGPSYSAEEEEIHCNFLSEYVNSGRRPTNFVLNANLEQRFKEYPKLQRLIELHGALVDEYAHPPMYLQTDFSSNDLLPTLSPMKYDCILIDPPKDWSWEKLATLPIPQLAATPTFLWIWCGSGSGNGLEKGRELLAKWGYRRSEDICWVKTNKKSVNQDGTTKTLLTCTKEHCLMGIRGTVRRSTDAHFVHCNVDTDVIVWEGDESDANMKPPELYNIIENFCLGNRRLQIFGNRKNLRRGWLTVGPDAAPLPDSASDAQAYVKEEYESWFDPMQGGSTSVPNTPEVDELRPKSPPPRGQGAGTSGGGIGRGRGRGTPFAPPQQQQGFVPPQHSMMNPMQQQMMFNNPQQAMMFNNPMMGMGMMPPFMPMNPLAQLNASDWTSFFQLQQQQNRR